MPNRSATILDRAGNAVATADVESQGNIYSGLVHLDRMPATLRGLFEEYESIVNDQVFSRLDRIEDQIDDASLEVAFEDGSRWPTQNLQIFPRAGSISFVLTDVVAIDLPMTIRPNDRETAVRRPQATG